MVELVYKTDFINLKRLTCAASHEELSEMSAGFCGCNCKRVLDTSRVEVWLCGALSAAGVGVNRVSRFCFWISPYCLSRTGLSSGSQPVSGGRQDLLYPQSTVR